MVELEKERGLNYNWARQKPTPPISQDGKADDSHLDTTPPSGSCMIMTPRRTRGAELVDSTWVEERQQGASMAPAGRQQGDDDDAAEASTSRTCPADEGCSHQYEGVSKCLVSGPIRSMHHSREPPDNNDA
eukprot:6735419-Pyramimonas_sp.AAC.5